MGPSPGPPPQTTKGPAALWKPAHSLLSFTFLRAVSLTEAVIKFFTQNAWYAGCRHPALGSKGMLFPWDLWFTPTELERLLT